MTIYPYGLPGDATDGLLVQLTSLGEVAGSPTANTVLDRLKALKTSVDAVKTSIDAQLASAGGAGRTVRVSHARPNDTTAYAINDVVGNTTAASGAVLTFANIGPSAGLVAIVEAELEIDVTTPPSGMSTFRLECFSATPPSALGDNAQWTDPAGDRAGHIGTITFPTPTDKGDTLRSRAVSLPTYMRLTGTSIFAYLVTDTAYTPTAQAVKAVTLHSVSV